MNYETVPRDLNYLDDFTWIYTMKNNIILFFWHDVIFLTP